MCTSLRYCTIPCPRFTLTTIHIAASAAVLRPQNPVSSWASWVSPSGHAPPWLKVGDPQVTHSALSPGPLSPPSPHVPSLSTLLPGWVAGFFLLQRMDDRASKSLHHEKLILQATEHQSFGPHKETEKFLFTSLCAIAPPLIGIQTLAIERTFQNRDYPSLV